MQRVCDISQHRQLYRSTPFLSSFDVYIFVYRFYAIRIAKCSTHVRNKKRDLIPERVTRIAYIYTKTTRTPCLWSVHAFFRLCRWAYVVDLESMAKDAKWKSCVNADCCEPSMKDDTQQWNWDGFISYFWFVTFCKQALKLNHILVTQQIIGIRSTEWAMILLQHLQFQIVRMKYLKSHKIVVTAMAAKQCRKLPASIRDKC